MGAHMGRRVTTTELHGVLRVIPDIFHFYNGKIFLSWPKWHGPECRGIGCGCPIFHVMPAAGANPTVEAPWPKRVATGAPPLHPDSEHPCRTADSASTIELHPTLLRVLAAYHFPQEWMQGCRLDLEVAETGRARVALTGRAEARAATAHYLSSRNEACDAGDSEPTVSARLEQGIRPDRQGDVTEAAEEEAIGMADVDTGEDMPWYDWPTGRPPWLEEAEGWGSDDPE